MFTFDISLGRTVVENKNIRQNWSWWMGCDTIFQRKISNRESVGVFWNDWANDSLFESRSDISIWFRPMIAAQKIQNGHIEPHEKTSSVHFHRLSLHFFRHTYLLCFSPCFLVSRFAVSFLLAAMLPQENPPFQCVESSWIVKLRKTHSIWEKKSLQVVCIARICCKTIVMWPILNVLNAIRFYTIRCNTMQCRYESGSNAFASFSMRLHENCCVNARV